MHNFGYRSALARRACRYSDARPPRKTDGVLLESEIPPRMRGKDIPAALESQYGGITPAYAGKSRGPRKGSRCRQDHPRVCGEKSCESDCCTRPEGSPPRMRGKGSIRYAVQRFYGITPAYAGKSRLLALLVGVFEDHPRVCGEKRFLKLPHIRGLGSPPHMRGKGWYIHSVTRVTGITPAYAGKSTTVWHKNSWGWDHPRICGEKQNPAILIMAIPGSPPHMRGKDCCATLGKTPVGITPAYAGKRLDARQRTRV